MKYSPGDLITVNPAYIGFRLITRVEDGRFYINNEINHHPRVLAWTNTVDALDTLTTLVTDIFQEET